MVHEWGNAFFERGALAGVLPNCPCLSFLTDRDALVPSGLKEKENVEGFRLRRAQVQDKPERGVNGGQITIFRGQNRPLA